MSHFDFNMDVANNHALFQASNRIVIVDSFDNQTFEVRAGTLVSTINIGAIQASSSEELNEKLESLVNEHPWETEHHGETS